MKKNKQSRPKISEEEVLEVQGHHSRAVKIVKHSTTTRVATEKDLKNYFAKLITKFQESAAAAEEETKL